MRLFPPHMLLIAVALSGIACAFWLVTACTTTAIGLGGSPHHLVLALWSLLGGMAVGVFAGQQARFRIMVSTIAIGFATGGFWVLFGHGLYPPWASVPVNLVPVAALSACLGYALGPGLSDRTTAGMALATAGAGLMIAPSVMAVSGPRGTLAVVALSAVAASVTMSLQRFPRSGETTGFPFLAKGAIAHGAVTVVVAGWLSGIIVATLHALESGRLMARGSAWWAIGLTVFCAGSTACFAAPRLCSGGLRGRFVVPVLLAIAGAASTTILAAAPAWPAWLRVSDGAAWPDATWLVLAGSATLASCALAVIPGASKRPGSALFFVVGLVVSGVLWELAAMPRLGTEGLLRLLGAAAFVLSSLWAMSRFPELPRRPFATAAFAVTAGACTIVPLLLPPWEPAPRLSSGQAALHGAEGTRSQGGLFLREDQHGPVVAVADSSGGLLFIRGYPARPRPPSDSDPFLGLLAPLLHPHPAKALVVGSGTGKTLDLQRAMGQVRLTWLNLSVARAVSVSRLMESALPVFADPRIEVRFGALRTFSRRDARRFDTVTVLAPPINTPEREHLYSTEGFRAVERLLDVNGVAVVELPLAGGRAWVARVLATFHHVFPHGLVWLCPGVSTSLALSTSPAHSQVSLAAIDAALTDPSTARSLRAVEINTPEDVLGQLLLVPSGLEDLVASPLSDFDRMFDHTCPGTEALLADFLPILRPLAASVDSTGSRYRQEQVQQLMDEIFEHHRAYLSMLVELDKGVFTKVVTEAHNLLRGPRARGSELDILTSPYLARAQEYRATGQLDKAIEQLSVVRIVDPGRPDVPLLLGQLYEEKGAVDQAQVFYEEALRLDPESYTAQVRLAAVYGQKARYGEAISLLERAIMTSPTDAVLYHNLGTLYLAAGSLGKAKEHFERAIQLDRTLGRAHAGLAEVLFRSGRTGAAAVEAEIAVRLDPSPSALNLMGQIALRQGQREKARMAFLRCLLKDPDHIEARGGMGILAAEDGDIDQARENLEKILQMDPDNRAARENLRRLNDAYPALPYEEPLR